MWFIILIVFAIILFLILKRIKRLRLDCITLVVGAPKTGKTTIQCYLALKAYKRALFKWRITKLIGRKTEKPLLYSNIPLKVPYVPLTKELLMREKRFAYKSVILLSETSLIADSMSSLGQSEEVQERNFQLSMFYKLIGHELHGGAVFVETQAPSDNHYALKRCLSRYYWVHSLIKWIPFVLVARVREMSFNDGETINSLNIDTTDIENNFKWLIFPKAIWKKFDCYAMSIFTDNLPVEQNEQVATCLKCKKVVSFNKRYLVYKGEDKK